MKTNEGTIKITMTHRPLGSVVGPYVTWDGSSITVLVDGPYGRKSEKVDTEESTDAVRWLRIVDKDEEADTLYCVDATEGAANVFA